MSERKRTRVAHAAATLWSLVAGTVMLPVSAAAQAAAPVDVQASFDVANAYVFRGMGQDDTGVIMWPAVDVRVPVVRGSSSGVGRVTARAGTWNSLHTGATGREGIGQLWYQADLFGGATVGLAWGVDAGASIVTRSSPNQAFSRVTELVMEARAPRHWLRPYGMVGIELKGQFDGGREQGRYLELGARPTLGRTVTVALPVKVGLSLGGYYEGLRGDERFGFFSVGGTGELPLGTVRAWHGRWNVHGGVEYIRFGDRNELVFGKARQVVVSGGLGFRS